MEYKFIFGQCSHLGICRSMCSRYHKVVGCQSCIDLCAHEKGAEKKKRDFIFARL